MFISVLNSYYHLNIYLLIVMFIQNKFTTAKSTVQNTNKDALTDINAITEW